MNLQKQKCLDAAFLQFSSEMKSAKMDGKNTKKGTLEKIIREQKEKFNLSAVIKIKKEAICWMNHQGNLTAKNMGPDANSAMIIAPSYWWWITKETWLPRIWDQMPTLQW